MLYLLGVIYASEKQLIRSEGLFRTAVDFYENRLSFEKVEVCLLYSKVLGQMDIRKKEAEGFEERAKELAGRMPYWYPYMVNFVVPGVEFVG